MKILVTGATSGLGRNAVELLLQDRMLVRATGRDCAVGEVLQSQGALFEAVDLACMTEDQAHHLVRDVDAVWHCGALSSPWGRAADFEAVNVRATKLLATAAARRGVPRFVHVSTASIYFDFRAHVNIPETFRAKHFVNAYAASKAKAETAVIELVERHPGTLFTILRPRALFGPHDRVILPRLLALFHRRDGKLPLPNGGRSRMDFTYVGNMVQAMHLASTATGFASGEAFNITNQQPFKLVDLLQDLLERHLGLEYRICALPYPALAGLANMLERWGHVSGREPMLTRYSIAALHYSMTLDNRKAQQLLRYFPKIDMQQALMHTANWHRANGKHHNI